MQSAPANTRTLEKTQAALLPIARRVFWWDEPTTWLDNIPRFAAQVMIYGDWNDTVLTRQLLGDTTFKEVLKNPPTGVFDLKSWTYWHRHYNLPVPPLPKRKF
jgi:hypothetical protein